MKGIIHLFVVASLLLGSVGVSVTRHYCMDILKSISLNSPPGNCCGNEEIPGKCCHNESETYSLDQDMKMQHVALNLISPVKEIENSTNHLLVIPDFDVTWIRTQYYKYPPPSNPDLFIKFGSFLI